MASMPFSSVVVFAPVLRKCPQTFSDGTCKVKPWTVRVDDLFQILFSGSFSVPDVPFPNTCLLSYLPLWAPAEQLLSMAVPKFRDGVLYVWEFGLIV